jgi:hypothetical protein
VKRFWAFALTALSFMAILLTACAGLPAQAEDLDTPTTVPSTTPAPAVVEPTSEGTPIVSHGGPVVDYASLVDALRAAGATVEPAGEILQPFFAPPGQALKVNGADVQVFEFIDEDQAEAAASQVAPDGGSFSGPDGVSQVGWIDTPHFFKSGRLIVMYVGSDPAVTGLLEPVLGQQFAGR